MAAPVSGLQCDPIAPSESSPTRYTQCFDHSGSAPDKNLRVIKMKIGDNEVNVRNISPPPVPLANTSKSTSSPFNSKTVDTRKPTSRSCPMTPSQGPSRSHMSFGQQRPVSLQFASRAIFDHFNKKSSPSQETATEQLESSTFPRGDDHEDSVEGCDSNSRTSSPPNLVIDEEYSRKNVDLMVEKVYNTAGCRPDVEPTSDGCEVGRSKTVSPKNREAGPRELSVCFRSGKTCPSIRLAVDMGFQTDTSCRLEDNTTPNPKRNGTRPTEDTRTSNSSSASGLLSYPTSAQRTSLFIWRPQVPSAANTFNCSSRISDETCPLNGMEMMSEEKRSDGAAVHESCAQENGTRERDANSDTAATKPNVHVHVTASSNEIKEEAVSIRTRRIPQSPAIRTRVSYTVIGYIFQELRYIFFNYKCVS